MKVRTLCFFALLPMLSACGGGGSSGSSLLPDRPQSVQQTEALSDALRSSASANGSTDLLYVANTGSNAINVYKHDAAGNTAPLYVIAGSKTGITAPGQLSEDAQGNLYVANGISILIFAHGASGNVAPIRSISGSLTGIHQVATVTVDVTTGKIFVTDEPPNLEGESSLIRFAPNASGNVAPLARSESNLYAPLELTSDSTGNNLIYANSFICCNTGAAGASTVAKQFANGASTNFLYSIDDLMTAGAAADTTTKTYLLSTDHGIYRLAQNTIGNGPDSRNGPITQHLTPAPVSVITNEICAGQLAVAPGPTPYTYAVHDCKDGTPAAIRVYANAASGNATPVRTLTGSATKLDNPSGIYEGM